MHHSIPENAAQPGLFRRLAAILYDSVLVLGLIISSFALLYLPLAIGLGMENLNEYPLVRLFIQVCLFLVASSFHLWFWTHGGQTLGMRAWRLRLFSEDGKPVRLQQAIIRYVVAIVSLAAFGLGFFWVLFDKNRRAWHDMASHTRLLLVTQ